MKPGLEYNRPTMPELPEVETIVTGLRKFLKGRIILEVKVLEPVIISGSGAIRKASKEKTKEFIQGLCNQKISTVSRRGKNILVSFASGSVLVIHLKMTGQLTYHPLGAQGAKLPLDKHTRIIFVLDKGTLCYNDIRKFGYVLLFSEDKKLYLEHHFSNVGVDPMERTFTPKSFKDLLARKKGILKNMLLGQKVVAGLGNIYSDEACFEAGILPKRKVETLTQKEIERLHDALTSVLKKAIAKGGSSFSNYVRADGTKGDYVRNHKVYGRAGKPCVACSTILSKNIVAGRTTVFCRTCQR